MAVLKGLDNWERFRVTMTEVCFGLSSPVTCITFLILLILSTSL